MCAGFRIFLAANSLVLCYYLGPKRSSTVAVTCALACAAGRAAHILVTSKKVHTRCVMHVLTQTCSCLSPWGKLASQAAQEQHALSNTGKQPLMSSCTKWPTAAAV